MDAEPNRTSEEVIALAEHAKLTIGDLLPITQSIYFGQNYEENDSVKLIEMNPEFLSTLTRGDRFILRGEENDNSIICSEKQTFEMRSAETSNSILLVDDLKLPAEIPDGIEHSVTSHSVTGIHHKYLELKVCKPKLQRLKVLLEENVFCGNIFEDSKNNLYSYDDLLNTVQGSEMEIKSELKNLKAYTINGHWRLLEFDYHFKVLSHILNLIESNSWSLDKVPKKETLQTLGEIEVPEIISQCFQYFFEEIEENCDDDLYRICDIKVSCFCAEMLLRASGKFNLEEFLTIWQQSVPEGIATHISHLESIGLVDDLTPASVKYFPSSSLPENAVERFLALFEEKSKWAMHEIRPYLSELTTENGGVSTLLAKYARASTQDGIKYYSSKHLR